MKALISLGNIASFIALVATLALISTPPAHAQSTSASAGPDESQYMDCSSGAAEGCTAADIEEAIEAMGETASQGTAATNNALGSPTAGVLASSPPSPDSASVSAAPTASRETIPSDDGTDRGKGTPGIEVLPETGGAPLLGLCAGVCLLGCGLLLARLAFV